MEKTITSLQQKLLREMQQKEGFEKAKSLAFDYIETAFDRNVYPTDEAIDNLSVFEEDIPEKGMDTLNILDQLHEYGAPASVINIGGRYFGFVNGSAIPASLATKWMTDVWDQNTALNVISPISAKLESVVEKWFQQLFNLPAHTVAGYVSGTSIAIFSALAAARYRLYKRQGWNINNKGFSGAPKIRLVAGQHIHATVKKAIALLGLGIDNIEWVEVDDQGRMIPEKMPELDETTLVLLQAGNVNSGAFDPIDIICDKANAANAWVHVDGAFGLWAGGVEKLKYLTKGMEKAQSWSVDGHKTLNTPYDSGIVLCADKEALASALQATGSYIIYGEHRDGMLFTPEMSRRARVIELWAAIKSLGKQGIDEMVWNLHERAKQFGREILEAGFEVLNDIVFNQVIVACDSDEETERVLEEVQKLRTCWCGGSNWFGRRVIRISICSWMTTEEDITKSVQSFLKAKNT